MEDMYTKKTDAPRANNVKKINSKPFNRFSAFLSLLIIIVAFSMVILPKKTYKVANETGIVSSHIPYNFTGNGWDSSLVIKISSLGPEIERTIYSPKGERSYFYAQATYCGKKNVCFYDYQTKSDVVISRIDDKSIRYDATFRATGEKQTLVFSH